MTDINKILDLCYTASFAFDRLAEISMQVNDLEKESIKTPISVENVEQNVIKFNSELEEVPRMRPSNRTYVPRRNTFAPRSLMEYRQNSTFTNHQAPNSYRVVPNTGLTPKPFNLRSDQVNTSSITYRKRPTSESFDGATEVKHIKGIKWVAASSEEAKNSLLNIENLAKGTKSRIKIEPMNENSLTSLGEQDAAINSILRFLDENNNESETNSDVYY